MAPRQVNGDVARNVVQESLGLTDEDLGMNANTEIADLDLGDDDGDGEGDNDLDADNLPGARDGDNDGLSLEQPVRQKPDDKNKNKNKDNNDDGLSVTHTPKDEFDHGKPKFDAKGNILGSKGQIIATAGREARMYTQLHSTREKLNSTIQQANTTIQDVQTRLQKAVDIGIQTANQLTAIREIGQAHTKAGINDQELQSAIGFAAAYKKNPLEGLKKILTEAAASGIDLTQLGLQPGGFDPSQLMELVRGEITKLTQPIQQRTQQETAQQQAQRERDQAVTDASTNLNKFLTANPDARQYVPVFLEIYKQPEFANMSLGEVWARIQLNLLKSRQSGDQNQNGNRQQRSQNRQQQPRLPNGQGRPPGGNGNGRPTLDELAPVSTSYEDIVRDVLTAVQ